MEARDLASTGLDCSDLLWTHLDTPTASVHTIEAENTTYIIKIAGDLVDLTRCNTLHHESC